MSESGELQQGRFTVDSRRVVHEEVDGEVIIVQLESGSYYSLGGSGPEVWELLVGGLTPREAAEAIAERHGDDAERIGGTVERLVEELRRERLILPRRPGDGAAPPLGDPAGRAVTGLNGFAEPVLERYTDMEDYLLIDPIHEVEAGGWPDVKRA